MARLSRSQSRGIVMTPHDHAMLTGALGVPIIDTFESVVDQLTPWEYVEPDALVEEMEASWILNECSQQSCLDRV